MQETEENVDQAHHRKQESWGEPGLATDNRENVKDDVVVIDRG